jgi:hypothetical protein
MNSEITTNPELPTAKKTTAKKTTAKKTTARKLTDEKTYQSFTGGTTAESVSPSTLQKIFNQYPEIAPFLNTFQFNAGREYTLFISHNIIIPETGKKSQILQFVRYAGTRKNLTLKKPAITQFTPETAKKTYGTYLKNTLGLTDLILIIGYAGRGSDVKRYVHISFRF